MKAVLLEEFDLTRKNTYLETFVFYDEADSPIDLSSYQSLKMDIRKGLTENSELIFSVSLGDGIEIKGENNNILQIKIEHEDTDWSPGQYYRDLKVVDPEGDRFTYCYGYIKVRSNITE